MTIQLCQGRTGNIHSNTALVEMTKIQLLMSCKIVPVIILISFDGSQNGNFIAHEVDLFKVQNNYQSS